MSVIIKQLVTRPSLHDLYWFELQSAANIINHLQSFNSKAIQSGVILSDTLSSWDSILIKKDQLRPDIIHMIDTGLVQCVENFEYDPVSLVLRAELEFDSIDECREANQTLFDAINPALVKVANETNNKIRDEIYDESGNFLEYGLFDIK